MRKKYDCIFLDRDGTINLDTGYISRLQDFKFFDFAIEALDMLKILTDNFIIITNQSGVARGLIFERDLIKINQFIFKKFLKNSLQLLDIYYCIDHPNNVSGRRKPGVDMFVEASKDYNLNLSKCLMIGDSKTDILPAKTLGMESMLVLSGLGEKYKNSFDENEKPDYISKDLLIGAIDLVK